MSSFSRRNFLRGGAAAAGAVTFSQLFGYKRVFGQSDGDDPQTILNLAATAEAFACTHYYNALQNVEALGLDANEVRDLRTFLDAELKHKQFLEANGAQALALEFYVPENLFADRIFFVNTTDTAENWFVAAYLAATRRFAELGEPLLAATAAQVMGVEAEHQALIRQMGGLVPSNTVLKRPLFYNTSEVVPLFQPFLEGADGFVGPVPFPGDDAIAAEVGDEGALEVTPFILLTEGMGTLEMEAGMETEDTMTSASAGTGMVAVPSGEGACTVSATNTNIRMGPSTSTEIVGKLDSGEPMPVLARTVDSSGFTWYQIEAGWVRADVVQATGNCVAVALS